MDTFTFTISLTLAVTGFFLLRDYTHFLKGAYARHGKVISIQQKFYTNLSSETSKTLPAFVKNGFYPVIECSDEGGTFCFTAIDHHVSGDFNVGDLVNLKIFKSRRQTKRTCKTLIALTSMLVLLGIGLISAALTTNIQTSLGQVFLASCVIAAGLSILALYTRVQDENFDQKLSHTKSGHTQLCLAEPTAYEHWSSSRLDPIQRSKIRNSQFCGATFMGGALLVFAFAIQPLAQIFFKLI